MADNDSLRNETSHSLRTELGCRLARQRLARNVTQEALAKTAGIGLRTLRRVEAGDPSSLDSVLRVVIALGLADSLMAGIPTLEVRPIERVEYRGRERRRARPTKSRMPDESWSWSDGPDD